MHFDSEDGLQTVVTTVVSCPDGTLHGPLELPAAFGAGSGSESLDGRRPSASSRAAFARTTAAFAAFAAACDAAAFAFAWACVCSSFLSFRFRLVLGDPPFCLCTDTTVLRTHIRKNAIPRTQAQEARESGWLLS